MRTGLGLGLWMMLAGCAAGTNELGVDPTTEAGSAPGAAPAAPNPRGDQSGAQSGDSPTPVPSGAGATLAQCAADSDCACDLACVFGQCAGADAGLDLFARWSFEEASGTTAEDSSGNGHNGELLAAVTRGAGYAGGGLVFGVSAGLVDVQVPAGEAFEDATLSAWVKLPTVMSPANVFVAMGDALVSMVQNTGVRGFTLGARPDHWHVNSKGSGTWASELNVQAPDSAWHHVVATFDHASAQRTLYVDGVEVGRDAYYVTGPTTIKVIRLGGGAYGWVFRNGMLDEVRVYKRALTALQVDVLYRSTRATCDAGL